MSAQQEPTLKQILLGEVIEAAGKHALDTCQPSADYTAPEGDETETNDYVPPCTTQKPVPIAFRSGPASIMLGMEKQCPRWNPGSVIRWTSLEKGFKTKEDALFATNHLHLAAKKWNEFSIGVTFEWVPRAEDATFVLCHGGDNGSTFATAFFPNGDDLSSLQVYNAAFSIKLWKDNMWKVFTHELGHVLGLRHEFALDTNPQTGEVQETAKAVQLGPRNPASVMTYGLKPPQIQQSDIDSTRAFYALQYDAEGNPPMVGGTAVVDYTPM